MSDINKFTTKEVLNKVLLDSSGDAVAAFSHTTQEAFNAALDDANSRLNVSLVGGTIGGDVTISGDLTVNGSAGGTYDEIFNGNLIVNHDSAEIAGFKRTNGSNDSAQARIAIGNDTKTAYLGLDGDEKFHIGFTQNLTNNTAFVIDDANNNVGIGTASSSSYNNFAHNLVVYEAGHSGITIATNGTNHTSLYFADGTSGAEAYAGYLDYDHNDNSLDIATNATLALTIDSSQNATFAGDVTLSNASSPTIRLTDTTNSTILDLRADDTGALVRSTGNHPLRLNTNQVDRMVLDANSRISLSNNDSGTSNTIFGKLAGNSLASGGNNNVLIGENAGDVMSVCDDNVGIGLNAIGQATTQTDRVVAIGSGAMAGGIGTADITGLVAIGYESLAGSLEAGADYTVAVGYQSLKSLTSGAGNTSIGYQSSEDVNTGAYNTVMGYQAFSADTDGSANVAIGWKAGRNIHGSTQNVMIGYKAMANIDNNPADNIANCVAIGYEAFLGSDNDSTGTTTATNGTIAIGHSALKALTEGIGNVAVGFEALKVNTDGDYNTAIGHEALKAQAGQSGTVGNTAVGHGAAETITTSVNITALGFEALSGATTEADGNTAIGFQSMDGNWTTAAHVNSVAVGSKTMRGVLTATSSGTVGIGYQALNALTSGTGVTAAGFQAGQFNTTGASSTFIGYQAGQGVTGAKLTGNANTAIGRQSGFLLQGGAGGNTLLGYLSGDRITTGTNNTILGQGADTDDATATNQAVIGQGAIGVADNSVTLGNASVTAVYIAKGNDTSQDLNFFDSAGGGGNIQYTHVDDQMKFGVADGVRARLFAGSLRPGADDTQDLGTASAAWKTLYVKDGINFPDDASSNPSSDVNTLDSYEEGTWTPVYFNITDDANVTATYDDTKFGFYTKIGRVVTLSCYMRTDALTAPDANDLIGIGGLPFTISAGSDGHSGYPTSRFLITASLWADNPQTISVGESEAFARLNAEVSANSEDDTAVHTLGNDLTAGTSNNKNQLAFSITYQV